MNRVNRSSNRYKTSHNSLSRIFIIGICITLNRQKLKQAQKVRQAQKAKQARKVRQVIWRRQNQQAKKLAHQHQRNLNHHQVRVKTRQIMKKIWRAYKSKSKA